MFHSILVLLMLFTLSGCGAYGNARLTNEELVSTIKTGQTTQADVLRLLGEPEYKATQLIEGRLTDVWWEYGYTKMWPTPLAFVPVIGLVTGGSVNEMAYDNRTLTVFFSPSGVVDEITAYKSPPPLWSCTSRPSSLSSSNPCVSP